MLKGNKADYIRKGGEKGGIRRLTSIEPIYGGGSSDEKICVLLIR